MGNARWTDNDVAEFTKLVSNGIKDYKNVQALAEAHNALADVKRTPGAVAFRLRSHLDAGLFSGEKKDHVESMLYVYYSSVPKKEKKVPMMEHETRIEIREEVGTAAYMPASALAERVGYSSSWVEQLAMRNLVRRSRASFTTRAGQRVLGWVYSVNDVEKYLMTIKSVPPENRRNGKSNTTRFKADDAAVVDFKLFTRPPTNNRERLLKLFKDGKVDVTTTLDMLEKL